MGQKDIIEKNFVAYNDVFADIVNVLVFNGKHVVHENELVDVVPKSAHKINGKYKETERDVVKKWQTGSVRIACLGIENQTSIDTKMPLRVISYDSAEYKRQYDDKSIKKGYPVLTLVLYFGYEKPWTGPVTLKQCLNIADDLDPCINDYKINLHEIAYLSHEQVNMFRSDFRYVADFFVQMRETGKYTGTQGELAHARELFEMLSAVADDDRFEDIFNNSFYSDRETKDMCKFIDDTLAQGRAEGLEKGLEQGRAEGRAEVLRNRIDTAKNLIQMGMDYAFIAKALGISEEEVPQLVQ